MSRDIFEMLSSNMYKEIFEEYASSEQFLEEDYYW